MEFAELFKALEQRIAEADAAKTRVATATKELSDAQKAYESVVSALASLQAEYQAKLGAAHTGFRVNG